MITYSVSSNVSEKPCFQLCNISSYIMNLVSSFINDFLFTSFQQKNEIKKRKCPNAANGIQIFIFLCEQINLFDAKDIEISKEV